MVINAMFQGSEAGARGNVHLLSERNLPEEEGSPRERQLPGDPPDQGDAAQEARPEEVQSADGAPVPPRGEGGDGQDPGRQGHNHPSRPAI